MSAKPIIILFNGPPRSGKDTATVKLWAQLAKLGVQSRRMKFADPLKKAVGELFGLSERQLMVASEGAKDKPYPPMMGRIPREEFIRMSEHYAKFHYGQYFFGHVAAQRILSEEDMKDADVPIVYIFSDSGFADEAIGLYDVLDDEVGDMHGRFLVVKMSRPDTSFEGDSRSYVTLSPTIGAAELSITNDDDLANLDKCIEEGVLLWLRTLHKELNDILMSNADIED